MFKKVGMVTVGITAGLLAAAPLASAGEAPSHHGHGDHKQKHSSSDSCDFKAGDAEAGGSVSGDSEIGNVLTQAPVGGANAANIACNDILNGNLNGNHLSISVLGEDEEPVVVEDEDAADEDAPADTAPEAPETPELPLPI